jgi:hypothetical protein
MADWIGVDMTEATRTPAPVALHECTVCRERILGGTAVATIEGGSGAGRTLYACTGCVRVHRLLPLDEQTSFTGDGRLQYRPRTARG